MKKDAYWFSHDSNSKDDPKCVMLIESLGLEGYGIFWILVETLRDQPDYKYPLALLPAIARRYNSTTQKVETVVKAYGLFQVTEDEFFFSTSLMGRMEFLDYKRELASIAGKKSAEKRKQLLLPINDRSTTVEPMCNDRSTNKVKESKVKESKVKESKVKESKLNENKTKKSKDNIKTFIDDFRSNELLSQALDEFIKMRRLIRKPATDKAISLIIEKLNVLATNDTDKIKILNKSVENSWQGVFPLKADTNTFKKEKGNFNNYEQRTYDYDDLENKLLGYEEKD